jgi:hypothetical protein
MGGDSDSTNLGSGKEEHGGDDLVAAFARWAAGERVADAARQRSRERWLRQQAIEAATMTGVLTDLAEQRAEVTLRTRTHPFIGRMVGVARDFVVVEERSGAALMVATAHLASVSPLPGRRAGAAPSYDRGDPSGDRNPPLPILLVDALALLAADRSPVRLGVTSGELILGDLIAVGIDVITVQGDSLARGNGPARRDHLYIPLAAVEVCAPR